ncbi:MAG: hypothetical protein ABJA78_11570 [Ferruginibacter sp.]
MQSTRTTKVSTLFIAASMLAIAGFSSCNNGDSKSDATPKVDSPATTPAKVDSQAMKMKMDSPKMAAPAMDSPKLKQAKLRPVVPNS